MNAISPQHLQLAQEWLLFAGGLIGPLLLKSFAWAVLFAFLGLLAASSIMVWLQRRRLLRREHRAWNWAAKLSYLLVLAACVLGGAVAGALFGVQRDINRAVTEHLQPALTAQMPALRGYLAQYAVPLAQDGLITARDLVRPLMQDFLYQPKSDGMIEQLKARAINQLVLKVGAAAMTQALHQALKQLPEVMAASRSGPQADLAGFAVDTVVSALAGTGSQLDLSPLDRSVPEMFVAAVHKQINAQFKALYIGLAIKLLIVALLIALEMLVYYRYYLPRRRPAQPPPAPATAV